MFLFLQSSTNVKTVKLEPVPDNNTLDDHKSFVRRYTVPNDTKIDDHNHSPTGDSGTHEFVSLKEKVVV